MTEPFLPDDDVVSAVLDGEASPEERARVEADPRLRARLEEFRRAAAFVAAAPPPMADGAREVAIARAKAEGQTRVVTLRPRRSPERILAIAAAVVFVVLLGGLAIAALGRGDGGYGSADSGSAGDGGGAGGGADAAESTSGTARDDLFGEEAGSDLGEVDDANALRLALLERGSVTRSNSDDQAVSGAGEQPSSAFQPESSPDATTEAGRGAGDSRRCQVHLESADPGLAGLLERDRATFAGTPAVVYVFATDEGREQVVAVSQDGCRVLAAFLV